MKPLHFLIFFLCGWASNSIAENLCNDDETPIFNCELPKRTSSLCQQKNSHTLTYRNGVRGHIDLEVSEKIQKGDTFYLSHTPYAGGGEAHIRFSRGTYEYYLYDRTVKTDDGPDFSAGILIYRGKKKIADFSCLNDASILQPAYSTMTREEYQDIGAK